MSLYTFDSDGELLVHAGYHLRLGNTGVSYGTKAGDHEYLLKIRLPNGKDRYFYTQEEIDAYYKEKKQKEEDKKQGRSRPDVNVTEQKENRSSESMNGFNASQGETKTYRNEREKAKDDLKRANENLREVKASNPEKRHQPMGVAAPVPTAQTLAAQQDYQKRLAKAEAQVKEAEEAYDESKKKNKKSGSSLASDPDFLKRAATNLVWKH